MLLLAKAMSGVSEFMELRQHIFEMVLTGTDVGLTWMVRISTLVLAGIAVTFNKRFPTLSLWAVTVFGALALATLAQTDDQLLAQLTDRQGINRVIDRLAADVSISEVGYVHAAQLAGNLPGRQTLTQHMSH